MSFDLSVVFTGVVAFVENDANDSRARMCALFVNGEPARTSTLDGTPLPRHRAFVRFPVSNVSSLEGGPGDESLGIWYLKGARAFIETVDAEGAAPGQNDFSIVRAKFPGADPHPVEPTLAPTETWPSYSWVLDMERVCPAFRVDPLLLTPAAPVDRIAAQVFIDRGRVSTKRFTNVVWSIPPTLGNGAYQQAFAQEVMVQYFNLSAARLAVHSLDGSSGPKYLDLTHMQRDGAVEIQLVNTCDFNPLQWPSDVEPRPDVDTKWIYELLEPSTARLVQARLGAMNETLPIPMPGTLLPSLGSPGSANCIPPRVAGARYTVPELDQDLAVTGL